MEKNEKMNYEKPEMDVVELENDAIWTTSGEPTECTAQHSSPNLNVSCG